MATDLSTLSIIPVSDFSEYMELALRTKSPGRMAPKLDADGQRIRSPKWTEEKPAWVMECVESGPYIDIEHGCLGIISECGEATSAIKSSLFYGKDFDTANYAEELGDAWWFWTIAIWALKELGADQAFNVLSNFTSLESVTDALTDEGFTEFPTELNTEGMRALEASGEMVIGCVVGYGYDSQEDPEELAASQESLVEFITTTAVALAELTIQFLIARHGTRDPEIIHSQLLFMWAVNIAKLRLRYPDKFSSDNAILRESLADERRVLEAGEALPRIG